MFFKREKERVTTFSEQMEQLRSGGYTLDSLSGGQMRLSKAHLGAVLKEAADGKPVIVDTGLVVGADGKAGYPVLAPRLKRLTDIQGRSLMVHVGGDNHADHPAPLGGGGARVACGVIS